jgi:hypothetical protein
MMSDLRNLHCIFPHYPFYYILASSSGIVPFSVQLSVGLHVQVRIPGHFIVGLGFPFAEPAGTTKHAIAKP